jgi:rubrerythrin
LPNKIATCLNNYKKDERLGWLILTKCHIKCIADKSVKNIIKNMGELIMDEITINNAKDFAKKAMKMKVSIIINFIDIPIYLMALHQSYDDMLAAMMGVINRVSFVCPECGRLDNGYIFRYYHPPYSPEKTICPICKGSDKVEIIYDPDIEPRKVC